MVETHGIGGRRHKLAPSNRRQSERLLLSRRRLLVQRLLALVTEQLRVDDAIRVYKESGIIVDINFRLRNCLVSAIAYAMTTTTKRITVTGLSIPRRPPSRAVELGQ